VSEYSQSSACSGLICNFYFSLGLPQTFLCAIFQSVNFLKEAQLPFCYYVIIIDVKLGRTLSITSQSCFLLCYFTNMPLGEIM